MKYFLFCVIITFYFTSCKNDQELKEKLNEALTKIENLEINSIYDSINIAENQKNILESLSNISDNEFNLSIQYEKLKSSIFLLYTSNGLENFQGTAFLIDNNGICISNNHVFEGVKFAHVENNNGNKYDIQEIIEVNKENDFIIFKIDLENDFINPLQISNTVPSIGEECFTIGNPKGLSQTISNGIISAFRKENNLIQTTTEITFGSSGGPLFNKFGQVIGITTSGYGEANLNFAINIHLLNLERYIGTLNNSTKEEITVNNLKTYFHNLPNENSRRTDFIIKGDVASVIESRNGFIYVIFQNSNGVITKGWIKKSDVFYNHLQSFSKYQEHLEKSKNNDFSGVGYTIGTNVIIRSEPTTESDKIGILNSSDTKLRILKKKTSVTSQALLSKDITFNFEDGSSAFFSKGMAITVTKLESSQSNPVITLNHRKFGQVTGAVDNSYIEYPTNQDWFFVEEINGYQKGWVFGRFINIEN